MLGLVRMFGKFANIQEIGKLPSEVTKHLKILGDLNTYKSLQGEKAVNSLDLLYKTSKRKLDLKTINWNKYTEIKVLSSELSKKLKSYSLQNILSIMKSCNKLGLKDPELWQNIESAVFENIYELEERQLYDLISCFSKKPDLNLKFWKELELIITEKFCPKHNIQATVVCMILSTYSKLGLLSDQFLAVLEQQVIRVHLNFDGIEVSKVLSIFVHSKLDCEATTDKLCKQAQSCLYRMDWYSTVTTLVCFVRLGKGDHVDEIEKCLKLWYPRLDLHLVANIFFAYAKHLPVCIRKETERRAFLIDISQFLMKNQEIWKDGEDKDLAFIMWGLAVARIFQFQGLWQNLYIRIKDLKKIRSFKEFKKVEEILKKEGKNELIQWMLS